MSTSEGLSTTSERTSADLESKFFGIETPLVKVQFGGATHQGLVRSNNEDHYVVVHRYRTREVLLTNLPADAYPPHQDSVYAFAVADGVGGAAFGELASELALRTGWELTTRAFKWGFSLSETEIAELEEGMRVYAQLIHRRIKAVAEDSFRGMGTTLTGALTVGWDAFVVHIGDSRAYLHRNGNLFRLTDDQTLPELMVKSGNIAFMGGFPGSPLSLGWQKCEQAALNPSIKVVANDPTNWDPSKVQGIVAGILAKNPDLKGLSYEDALFMSQGGYAAYKGANIP